jgi:predicted nucleotidyltransferase component of viral defense system
MLHTETVEPAAFSLLKDLMKVKELKSFSLVGGTALSLRYGHRKSDDLDLFSTKPFEIQQMDSALKEKFGIKYFTESKNKKWGIFCFINNIKVDIIHHPHTLISEIEKNNSIRMFSDPDIIAMKINAILGRGVKKDFWDLDELLNHYSLKQMIGFHEKKYTDQNLLITIPQALVYFDDAENSAEPISLKKQSWEGVKKSIQNHVRSFLS